MKRIGVLDMKLTALTLFIWLAVLVAVIAAFAGCASHPAWVAKDGGPIDPLIELRCEEYVVAKNGPRFTGFETTDRATCMRAHGYMRYYEVYR